MEPTETSPTEPVTAPDPETTISPTTQVATPEPAEATPPTPAEPAAPYADMSASSSSESEPSVVSGGDAGGPAATPVASGVGGGKSSKLKALFGGKKPMIIGAAVLGVLLIGGGAYYFGYYNNPDVILSQSLSNSGKGYTKLTTYLDDQSKLKYKGVTADGSYTLGSGSIATDGKLSFNSDGDNTDTTVDVNAGSTRVGVDLRAIKGKTTIPDIYFKVKGLDSLGALLGPDYASLLAGYNDQWITVDQSLLSSLQQMSGTAGTNSLNLASPSEAQVMDELSAFGKVNQDYVFTTDKAKSITTVTKKYGKEKVDGHNTYHYQVALNKDNVKKYLTAQQTALKSSKLNDWLKANKFENYVDVAFDSMKQSADNIKSSDTFDVWADISHRVIYKVRVADKKDPTNNYVDFGLDYKGGDDYPFFIKANTKDSGDTTTGAFVATLNTKTNKVLFDITVKGSGSSTYNFKANLSAQPTNKVTPITAPTGAIPLTQVLDKLGLTPFLTGFTGGGTGSDNSSFFTQ
jgi:hypothetical protein